MRKNILRALPLIAGALAIASSFQNNAQSQISGTAHDMSTYAWSQNEICIVCHTPHNALDNNIIPLWNHDTTTTTFTMYTSPTNTLDGTIGAAPGGVSRACLSCHDGTVNTNAYGGSSGNVVIPTTGAGTVISDLDTSHPVAMEYTTTTASNDGELYDPATTIPAGFTGSIQVEWLINDQVECSSCHNVHGSGNANFLHVDNTDSALCLTCHNK